MESGREIYVGDMVSKCGQMGQDIKANGRPERLTERVYIILLR
jgi:hypothetical protein